jgi:D-serine deaminase-like pyridoxal phosphate-dependent protein
MQMVAGACGIEAGAIERAAGMAAAGLEDILIAHPFYGEAKLALLRRLLERPGLKLTVMADMVEQAAAMGKTAASLGRRLPLLMKLNTGGDRFGVPPGEPALALARQLITLPGIDFAGLYAHESGGLPTPESLAEVARAAAHRTVETARLLVREGIPVRHVSVGASPTLEATCELLKSGEFPEIDEIHPGHCTIGDRWHILARANPPEACAATVYCTVISTADRRYAAIDAGYKTFGADTLIQYRDLPDFFRQGKPAYGIVPGRPDLWLGKMSAETAILTYDAATDGAAGRLALGERLRIIPNNATLAISLQREIYGVRKGVVERIFALAGRECTG